MNKYKNQIVALLLILCVMLVFSQPILGAGSDGAGSYELRLQTHEVVLLLDTGTSMNWNDPAFLGPDALRQVANSLPSYWHVGLVTFNMQIVDVVPPDSDTRAAIHTILEDVNYVDTSNPGVGLLQAAELFSDHALSRTIIFLTDGQSGQAEKTDVPTEVTHLTEQAIAQITASDIQTHIIAIGDNIASSPPILGLAHSTGGLLLRDIAPEDLNRTVSTLVFDTLAVARSPQMRGEMGSFTVRLPAEGVDFASVLITAESAIDGIVVTDGIGQVNVQTGRRFALIEISNPTIQMFNIAFAAHGNSGADLIVEWDLQLRTETESGTLTRFWLADSEGENVLLNSFFQRDVFPVSANEAELQFCEERRYLISDLDEREVFQILQVRLGSFGINLPDSIETLVYSPTPPVELPETAEAVDPPEEAETADPLPEEAEIAVPPERAEIDLLMLGLAIICFVLLIALCVYLYQSRRKQTAVSSPTTQIGATQADELELSAHIGTHKSAAQFGNSKFVFAGKLDLYVIIGSIDHYTEDMTSRVFRFPRRGSKRKQTVQDILKKCKLSNVFPGSAHIYFTADEQGALQIVNGSNCTILVGRDVLPNKRPYTLYRKGNVRIRDVYGTSELVISPRFLYRT